MLWHNIGVPTGTTSTWLSLTKNTILPSFTCPLCRRFFFSFTLILNLPNNIKSEGEKWLNGVTVEIQGSMRCFSFLIYESEKTELNAGLLELMKHGFISCWDFKRICHILNNLFALHWDTLGKDIPTSAMADPISRFSSCPFDHNHHLTNLEYDHIKDIY